METPHGDADSAPRTEDGPRDGTPPAPATGDPPAEGHESAELGAEHERPADETPKTEPDAPGGVVVAGHHQEHHDDHYQSAEPREEGHETHAGLQAHSPKASLVTHFDGQYHDGNYHGEYHHQDHHLQSVVQYAPQGGHYGHGHQLAHAMGTTGGQHWTDGHAHGHGHGTNFTYATTPPVSMHSGGHLPAAHGDVSHSGQGAATGYASNPFGSSSAYLRTDWAASAIYGDAGAAGMAAGYPVSVVDHRRLSPERPVHAIAVAGQPLGEFDVLAVRTSSPKVFVRRSRRGVLPRRRVTRVRQLRGDVYATLAARRDWTLLMQRVRPLLEGKLHAPRDYSRASLVT